MIISVDAPAADIIRIPLQDLLHFDLTFKGGFKELIFAHKFLIFMDHNLVLYKLKLDLKVVLPPYNKTVGNFLLGSLSLIFCACVAILDIVIKNKQYTNRLQRKKKLKSRNIGRKK